ncbi:MAG TPA: PAS domain-containing sensor histidine kinase [Sunxiuqinia sp.]|nr:PAS domain-containing sensor histidine kinase [Sunxiuqinia sp.]
MTIRWASRARYVAISFLIGSFVLLLFLNGYQSLATYVDTYLLGISISLLLGGGCGILVGILLYRNNLQSSKLKESEKKLQTLIDLSSDGIYIENEQGEIVDCNIKGHKMFGYSKEEMLQLSILDLVPTELRQFLSQIALEEEKKSLVFQSRENVKRDGTIFPTEVTLKYIDLEDQRHLILYVKDQTEKARLEVELERSEIKLKDLNETREKFQTIIADEIKNQFSNIQDYYGLVKENVDQLNRKAIKEYTDQIYSAAGQTNEVFENLLDWAMSQNNGASTEAITPNEIVQRVFVMLSDVGKKKNSFLSDLLIKNYNQTRKLKDSERNLRTLIDLSLDGIFIENERGDILDCNVSGQKMFGYTKEELLKLSIKDLVPSELSRELPEIISKEMTTSDSYMEYENIKKDGTVFPTEINTKFIKLNGKRRIIAYVKDNTGKREVEEALKESEVNLKISNETKDKLIRIIAHDLKNQFNGILGYSELIKENLDQIEEDVLQRYIEQIYYAADQTNNLLNNLLDWATLQKKGASFDPKKLNLHDIVQYVFENVAGLGNGKNTHLSNRVSDKLMVTADLNMLRTILRNLIYNAIKFSPNGGDIDVYAISNQKEQYVTVRVKDEGKGISSEKLSELFDNFDKNGSAKFGTDTGSGLGLVVCKEFVEKHQGKIWAESEEGKGATFFVQLPAVSEKTIAR